MEECSPNGMHSFVNVNKKSCMRMAMHGFLCDRKGLGGVCSPHISSNSVSHPLPYATLISRRNWKFDWSSYDTIGPVNSEQDHCYKTRLCFSSLLCLRHLSMVSSWRCIESKDKKKSQASSKTQICFGIRNIRNSLDCFFKVTLTCSMLYWFAC